MIKEAAVGPTRHDKPRGQMEMVNTGTHFRYTIATLLLEFLTLIYGQQNKNIANTCWHLEATEQ